MENAKEIENRETERRKNESKKKERDESEGKERETGERGEASETERSRATALDWGRQMDWQLKRFRCHFLPVQEQGRLRVSEDQTPAEERSPEARLHIKRLHFCLTPLPLPHTHTDS